MSMLHSLWRQLKANWNHNIPTGLRLTQRQTRLNSTAKNLRRFCSKPPFLCKWSPFSIVFQWQIDSTQLPQVLFKHWMFCFCLTMHIFNCLSVVHALCKICMTFAGSLYQVGLQLSPAVQGWRREEVNWQGKLRVSLVLLNDQRLLNDQLGKNRSSKPIF